MKSLTKLVIGSLVLSIAGCNSPDNKGVTSTNVDVGLFQPLSASHNLGIKGTKTVALTFDDGPNRNATPGLLDYLKSENIHATFFLIGNRVQVNAALVDRMRDEGHTIGNHSQNHPDMKSLGQVDINRVYEEISQADQIISPFLGPQNKFYFRPPEGAWATFESVEMNKHEDLRKYIAPVKWDVGGKITYTDENGKPSRTPTEYLTDAADWECWSKNVPTGVCARGYFNAIERNQGGIVLFHDRDPRTVILLQVLVPALKQAGYSFVSLDEIPAMAQFEEKPTAGEVQQQQPQAQPSETDGPIEVVPNAPTEP